MRLQTILLVTALFTFMIAGCSGGDGESPTAPTYPQGKPTGIIVTPASQSVTVQWNPVGGSVGYYVYISYDGVKFNKYKVDIVRTTSFTVFNLTNGDTYYFGVSAVGTTGWESSIGYPGGSPMAVPVVPTDAAPPNPLDGVPPDPPKNLQGTARDASATMSWEQPDASDFLYYKIYKSEGGSFQVYRSPYYDTTFTDGDLVNDQTYSYYITAVDSEDVPLESEPSNVLTLTPRDFPPEALTGTGIWVNPGRIVLEWTTPPENDIQKFAIERVEPDLVVPDGIIIARFVIDYPTGNFADPDIYASGLLWTWVDPDADRIVVQDMAVTVGQTYTYYISAIDIAGQEGSPVMLQAPIPVY